MAGEAIYGTRHWHTYGEGATIVGEGHMQEGEDKPFTAQSIRFTSKQGALYAISLGWTGANAVIKALAAGSPLRAERIDSIRMLGTDESLMWTQGDDGLHLVTPSRRPGDHTYTFKIALKQRWRNTRHYDGSS